MASQGRINAYMERHKIGPIFEDLMNKVLRDMPEEPMIYLLRAMYKKAGMEIPQGIRYGGLRKSTSELTRSSSPERPSRSAVLSSSADVAGSREYDKPWATSPTRRPKSKKSEEAGAGSKNRPAWNADNKVKSTFDELWGDTDVNKKEANLVSKTSAVRKSASKPTATSASAWAAVGLGEDVEKYTSPAYRGTQTSQQMSRLSEKDLLAMESVSRSMRSEPSYAPTSAPFSSSGRISNSRKMEAAKHRQELSQLLSKADQRLDDSGIGRDLRGYDDDAIELLENADDLRREGVKNVPKSGYKLSRNIRYRENEPKVKLNINVNPSYTASEWQDSDRFFDSPETVRSSPEAREETDDEVESVSQVTGPRQPVWKLPGMSDRPSGDAMPLRPSYSTEAPHPSNLQHKKYTEKSMYASTPARHKDRSVVDTDELTDPSKTWTEGVNRVSFEDDNAALESVRSFRSESSSGGWRLPEDTEVASARDWNQRVKGGPRTDPRAY